MTRVSRLSLCMPVVVTTNKAIVESIVIGSSSFIYASSGSTSYLSILILIAGLLQDTVVWMCFPIVDR